MESSKDSFNNHVYILPILMLAACLIFIQAVPASATAPDGYVSVYIEPEEYLAMYEAGDLVVNASVYCRDSSAAQTQLAIIDLNTSVLSFTGTQTYNFTDFNAEIVDSTLFFYTDTLFAKLGTSGYFQYTYGLNYPFSFYVDSTTFTVNIYNAGTTHYNDARTSFFIYNLVDGSQITSSIPSSNMTISQSAWDSLNPYADIYINAFPDVDFSAYSYMYSTLFYDTPTIDGLVNDIAISLDVITDIVDSTSNFSPVAFTMYPVSVWVPDTSVDPEDPDSPTYAEMVEEYLDSIVNPNPEAQERVNELQAEFERIDSELFNISSALDVEKPNVGNLIDGLPTDILDNNEVVSNNVMRPLLEIPLVVTLFTALFAIVALKLILYGSGKS